MIINSLAFVHQALENHISLTETLMPDKLCPNLLDAFIVIYSSTHNTTITAMHVWLTSFSHCATKVKSNASAYSFSSCHW